MRTNCPTFVKKGGHSGGVTYISTFNEKTELFNEPYYLMTASYDGTELLWDTRNLKGEALNEITFHGKALWDLRLS